jgi:peptidoglycan-associated lipoprotein
MKKIIDFGFVLALLALAGCSASKYHRANFEYDNMAYYRAAQHYSSYLDRHENPYAIIRLAQCYDKMHDYRNAAYWYSKAVNLKEAKPDVWLGYAMVLKANGKYTEAKQWFARYLAAAPDDGMARAQMTSCDSIDFYSRNAGLYSVTPLYINTDKSNFSMVPYRDGYVFCSEQPVLPHAKTSPWNGQAYLSLLFSRAQPNGRLTTPVPFSEVLNSPYHNGPVAFTQNFDRIYFCRSNYINNQLCKNSDNLNNIKIFTAARSGNDWADIKELPFNSNDFSCGQPTVTSSGDTIFFTSDRPGGCGNTDIYMSVKKNGKWGTPQNLGKNINTAGHEMFPYYHQDADGHACLYFSSDGLPGLGGLDIYCSVQQPDGSWGKPFHLDAPLNSPKDDFSILFSADGLSGYFSSSREGNGDKLFMFTKSINIFADGAVYDKTTNQLLTGARVEVNNQVNGGKQILFTDANGRFFTPLSRNANYAFNGSMEKYLPGSVYTTTIGKTRSDTLHLRIDLEPQMVILTSETYMGDMPLANVYFDFDKWNIRTDAKYQLDKVFERMLGNPAMRLEIGAHADSRGSDAYNMNLTRKRAMSVVNYLTDRGISKDRLTARWYGRSRPVNECTIGIQCSPQKHQQNRRAEFRQQQPASFSLK